VGEPIDIVVANAGMAESAPAHKTSLELWNRTLAVNLTGAFLSVKPSIGAMRERGFGRIVFIASTAGLKGYAYVAPYVAAKHGVVGLMRAPHLRLAIHKAGSSSRRKSPTWCCGCAAARAPRSPAKRFRFPGVKHGERSARHGARRYRQQGTAALMDQAVARYPHRGGADARAL
jgi:hypothetical protein